MQNKIKIKYVLHNLYGCELCDSMTLRMCIQFVGCMGNPKKCLSMWVGGKIISNLSCKDDERWIKTKWFFQSSKPLRLLERNFGLGKLKCKYFPSLVSKDNEGWVKSKRFLNLQELYNFEEEGLLQRIFLLKALLKTLPISL